VETLLAVAVGALYAVSLYMILRPSMVRLILGLAFLSHAANLLIFTAGRITRTDPPILPKEASQEVVQMANPLPQALILTAIVISFGVLAFAMVLLYRSYKTFGCDDLNTMRSTDQ